MVDETLTKVPTGGLGEGGTADDAADEAENLFYLKQEASRRRKLETQQKKAEEDRRKLEVAVQQKKAD